MVYNNACLVKRNALLAQLVEHLTLNQGVQGSSPWRRIEHFVQQFYMVCASSSVGRAPDS